MNYSKILTELDINIRVIYEDIDQFDCLVV